MFQQDLCGIEARELILSDIDTKVFQQDLCGIEALDSVRELPSGCVSAGPLWD